MEKKKNVHRTMKRKLKNILIVVICTLKQQVTAMSIQLKVKK